MKVTLDRLGRSAMAAQCPLCPRKRTSSDGAGMSAWCPKPDYGGGHVGVRGLIGLALLHSTRRSRRRMQVQSPL
jgi:hypothetical protein